jgi:hypothetical protein
MTYREKLTEVIYSMDICSWDWAGKIADHLLANGVTFATENNVGNKWIPVSERLPKEWKRVLALTNHKAQIVAKLTDVGWVVSWNHVPCPEITHWMPLPEPPKEDGYE